MLEYLDKVIIPYVDEQRVRMKKPEQRALCLFDVFAAHRLEEVKVKLESHNIDMVFIPAGCTSKYGYDYITV